MYGRGDSMCNNLSNVNTGFLLSQLQALGFVVLKGHDSRSKIKQERASGVHTGEEDDDFLLIT